MIGDELGPVLAGAFGTRGAAAQVRPAQFVTDDVDAVHAVTLALDIAALYRAQWRPMLRLAVLLVDDLGVAEDVVQDAFVALQRNDRVPTDPDAAVAYLRTTVVNRCRSVLRHRYVVARFQRLARPAPHVPDVTAELDADAATLQALQALPRRQREVIVLRYWADLTHAEIADILQIAVGSVKAAASRGLAAVRLELEQS